MANLKSAKKRALQNNERQKRNQARRSELKTLTKKFLEAIQARDITTAQQFLRLAESKIARAQGKKVLKRNTASRTVSALAKKLSGLEKKNV
jgi:small subunit ribosomal protein S20